MNVLITSPSIDPKDNVSGISNLTMLLMENNKDVEYDLFVSSKKDNEKWNLKWAIFQFVILYKFLKKIYLGEYNLIHINLALQRFAIVKNGAFALLSKLLKQKYVLHIHGGFYSKNNRTPFYLKKIVNYTLNKSQLIIVLGVEEKFFINSYYGIQNAKISVLSNSVKLPDFENKTYIKNNSLCLLYLGRIDKNKGLKEMIDALAYLPKDLNFNLKIAGDGPDLHWFLDLCNQTIKNKWHYEGIVSGDTKEKLLKDSHIFLLPSYYEGLPYSLLEAMSYGLASIVTPVGSIPEVVQDRYNGLLVEVKNSIQIKDAIIDLVNDNNLYKTIVSNAYYTIRNNYSLDNYINNLNRIYFESVK